MRCCTCQFEQNAQNPVHFLTKTARLNKSPQNRNPIYFLAIWYFNDHARRQFLVYITVIAYLFTHQRSTQHPRNIYTSVMLTYFPYIYVRGNAFPSRNDQFIDRSRKRTAGELSSRDTCQATPFGQVYILSCS